MIVAVEAGGNIPEERTRIGKRPETYLFQETDNQFSRSFFSRTSQMWCKLPWFGHAFLNWVPEIIPIQE